VRVFDSARTSRFRAILASVLMLPATSLAAQEGQVGSVREIRKLTPPATGGEKTQKEEEAVSSLIRLQRLSREDLARGGDTANATPVERKMWFPRNSALFLWPNRELKLDVQTDAGQEGIVVFMADLTHPDDEEALPRTAETVGPPGISGTGGCREEFLFAPIELPSGDPISHYLMVEEQGGGFRLEIQSGAVLTNWNEDAAPLEVRAGDDCVLVTGTQVAVWERDRTDGGLYIEHGRIEFPGWGIEVAVPKGSDGEVWVWSDHRAPERMLLTPFQLEAYRRGFRFHEEEVWKKGGFPLLVIPAAVASGIVACIIWCGDDAKSGTVNVSIPPE